MIIIQRKNPSKKINLHFSSFFLYFQLQSIFSKYNLKSKYFPVQIEQNVRYVLELGEMQSVH